MRFYSSALLLAGAMLTGAAFADVVSPLPPSPNESAGIIGQSFNCAMRPHELGCQETGVPYWVSDATSYSRNPGPVQSNESAGPAGQSYFCVQHPNDEECNR